MANYYYSTSNRIGEGRGAAKAINDIENHIYGDGAELFVFTSFTFTSPNEDPFAPTYSAITTQTAYSSTSWASNTAYFNVTDGIQYFKIPADGTYRITCQGAAGKNAGNASYIGYGGIVRGDFSLTIGTWLGMMIGHRPPTSFATSRYWQGGAGGTFVVTSPGTASGDNAAAVPLLVAGGGGHHRESGSSNRANCDAVMSPDGRSGTGSAGGTLGSEAAGGGMNQTGGGGAAGWSGQGDAHGDTRNLFIPSGYPGSTFATAYLPSAGFIIAGFPGRGGIFNTGYDQNFRGSGGFGGGGPGGWGGEGGPGGYSGGGNGNNSSTSYTGGGGSFISSSATNVGTSTGSWSSGSGYYSGHSGLSTSSGLTNLGYNTGSNGQVIVERL